LGAAADEDDPAGKGLPIECRHGPFPSSYVALLNVWCCGFTGLAPEFCDTSALA
jgi:hypothetical protein